MADASLSFNISRNITTYSHRVMESGKKVLLLDPDKLSSSIYTKLSLFSSPSHLLPLSLILTLLGRRDNLQCLMNLLTRKSMQCWRKLELPGKPMVGERSGRLHTGNRGQATELWGGDSILTPQFPSDPVTPPVLQSFTSGFLEVISSFVPEPASPLSVPSASELPHLPPSRFQKPTSEANLPHSLMAKLKMLE